MNSCEFYQELISSMVDGEISREEHEALMEHMKSCSACNAMYAVFHDLSDILAEENEELPEGLHENIMAGVRRSEIMKKNRRMRRFGLSTALTAAACAVLVLFAAAGIGPGRRAESVSIRNEEAAEQLLMSQSADTVTPQPTPVPAPAAVPAPAQIPAQTPAPVYTGAPADTYLAPGEPLYTQPNTPQQANPNDTEYEQSAPVFTFAPVIQPAPTVEPAPAMVAPPAAVQSETQDFSWSDARTQAPAAPAQPEQEEYPLLTVHAAPAAETEKPAEEESGGLLTLFSSMQALFESAPEEQQTEEVKLTSQNTVSFSTAEPALTAEEVLPDELTDAAIPDVQPAPAEGAEAAGGDAGSAAQADEKTPKEEKVSVYGKVMRAQLLAMLGESEAALPEAELTRLVHVTFVPEDAYGSEEKMDIRIYGDFIFCQRFTAEGGSKSYRADCALKDLDAFLLGCKLMSPSPAPTVDPYIAALPMG